MFLFFFMIDPNYLDINYYKYECLFAATISTYVPFASLAFVSPPDYREILFADFTLVDVLPFRLFKVIALLPFFVHKYFHYNY